MERVIIQLTKINVHSCELLMAFLICLVVPINLQGMDVSKTLPAESDNLFCSNELIESETRRCVYSYVRFAYRNNHSDEERAQKAQLRDYLLVEYECLGGKGKEEFVAMLESVGVNNVSLLRRENPELADLLREIHTIGSSAEAALPTLESSLKFFDPRNSSHALFHWALFVSS